MLGINQLMAQEKIHFPSLDSLPITADFYKLDDTSPMIVLCHQGKFSRGEYLFTAKKFNDLGFNCIAIDQRSGGEVNGIKNETAAAADSAQKKSTYLESEKDILAAVEYCYALTGQKVILLGSSYSASLVLKIAKENEHVAAALAFSPGEYFDGKLNVHDTIEGLTKPVFIVCTPEEKADVQFLIEGVHSAVKYFYVPEPRGVHGSRALWPASVDSVYIWVQMQKFLRVAKKEI